MIIRTITNDDCVLKIGRTVHLVEKQAMFQFEVKNIPT